MERKEGGGREEGGRKTHILKIPLLRRVSYTGPRGMSDISSTSLPPLSFSS